MYDADLGEKRRERSFWQICGGIEETGGSKKEDFEKSCYTLGIPFLVFERHRPRCSATLSILSGLHGASGLSSGPGPSPQIPKLAYFAVSL